VSTNDIPQTLDLALKHHQSGRLSEARTLYRKILDSQPNHAVALHFLGVVAHQEGKHAAATELIAQAIDINPGVPAFHNNLGEAWRALGKFPEAISAYQQAIKIDPKDFQAYTNLGTALKGQKKIPEAMQCYRKAIRIKPEIHEPYYNLGALHQDQGQLQEAIECYEAALHINPNFYEACNNLGNALKEQGKVKEAIEWFQKAIQLRPDSYETYNNLGHAHKSRGEISEAIACYEKAAQIKPNDHTAYSNLGLAYKELRKFHEAVSFHYKALQLNPLASEVYCNVGLVLQEIDKTNEAIACYKKAIELRPDLVEAHFNLGNTWHNQGNLSEAIACYKAALQHRPNYREGHNNLGNSLLNQNKLDEAVASYERAHSFSNILLTSNYDARISPQDRSALHFSWAREHAKPLETFIKPHSNQPDPSRKLKIGYVSPDFRKHVVATFFEPILAHHDPTQFEIYCYDNNSRPDGITERLQKLAPHWKNILNLSDEEVADAIRYDGIDILVDLTGHMANNRLLLFARKPAPIQITYLGYPNTTGLSTMDYRLTDALADPPETTESLHSEKLLRLPHSAWCYEAPAETPDVSPLPALESATVTFASFNNSIKISSETLACWSKILRAIPQSKLFLKAKNLGDRDLRQLLLDTFQREGIDLARIELSPWEASTQQHIAAYHRVDIALDTFPYHGTTTTCEALWMGVPVITLAGSAHVSRVGVSLLSNLGLLDLIATTPEQYVEIAVRYAQDLQKLKQLRSTLRERMKQSPLANATRLTQDIEKAYRDVWKQWCHH
jgi:protein O-GlcNAc transferase